MKKCKTCEFFDKNPINGWGDCNNEGVFHDSSRWPMDKPLDTALFKYHDCEGYGASFQVNENFGCIAHKQILK